MLSGSCRCACCSLDIHKPMHRVSNDYPVVFLLLEGNRSSRERRVHALQKLAVPPAFSLFLVGSGPSSLHMQCTCIISIGTILYAAPCKF